MKTKYEKAFDDYVSNYDLNEKRIRYKYHHSYKVEELMEKLANSFNLTDEEIELAKVIGLLHDIGRFEQIRKYDSSSDIKSGIDHANESCVYLFDEGHIKDFYDKEENYKIIKDAIKNHNKYEIDENVTGKNLLFAKMIRDMDKIDIYRVLSEEFSYEYDKNSKTKEVLDNFNSKVQVRSENIKTRTDSVLSYFAFLFGIYFKESFMILKEGNYLEKLFKIITPKEDSIEDFEILKDEMLQYINKKIETN